MVMLVILTIIVSLFFRPVQVRCNRSTSQGTPGLFLLLAGAARVDVPLRCLGEEASSQDRQYSGLHASKYGFGCIIYCNRFPVAAILPLIIFNPYSGVYYNKDVRLYPTRPSNGGLRGIEFEASRFRYGFLRQGHCFLTRREGQMKGPRVHGPAP